MGFPHIFLRYGNLGNGGFFRVAKCECVLKQICDWQRRTVRGPHRPGVDPQKRVDPEVTSRSSRIEGTAPAFNRTVDGTLRTT